MITLRDVTARSPGRPRVDLGPLTLSLDAGSSHAFVGAPGDGVELALSLLAGATPARKGVATVLGLPPAPGAAVAYAPYIPDLPEELTVAAFLTLSTELRGEPKVSPEERLSALGCAGLAARRIAHLSFPEARALALAEALTSRAKVLLLAEPFSEIDPRAAPGLVSAVEARVAAGALVVVSTASMGDARDLASTIHTFRDGAVTSARPVDDAWTPPVSPLGVRLFVRSEGARLLLAELASDPLFAQVHGDGAALVVTGSDPVAMAAAVADASRRANVILDVLSFEPLEGP